MFVKSVSLSDEADEWIRRQSELGATYSATLTSIILKHKGAFPEIRKEKALAELRAATNCLYFECDLPAEAILSWVRAIVEVQGEGAK